MATLSVASGGSAADMTQANPSTTDRIEDRLAAATADLDLASDREALARAAERDSYDGADADEIDEALIGVLTARTERDPAHDDAAARVARWRHARNVTGTDGPLSGEIYRASFVDAIETGVERGLLDGRMAEYDLESLAHALVPERDEQFGYMAVSTLVQRYFLRTVEEDDPLELPQAFWMRVAMGVALAEDPEDREARAVEFYDALSTLRFVHSTPTLFHAGTTHPQLSSCYLTTVQDDLADIFDSYKAHAKLSKWSGGLGNDWTNVRAEGSLIESTGVESTGVIPFLNISDDVTGAINRSGKRRGAACAYLAAWHLDFPAFLDLKRNTGDERRRTHEMNTAAWVPDLFMKRVRAGEQWTLFSPDEVPELHEATGRKFEELYEQYEQAADDGELRQYERVEAEELWRTMLTRLFETGHPWITFKDPCNVRSPQDHYGTINSSNLCTEITLNTSQDETAVCNLGSVNLAKHVDGDGLDDDALEDTVETAMRMLDNVVDLNFYPTDRAERANTRHRPVGLGVMGFHEMLTERGVGMASDEALDVADETMERVAYHAILNSSRLAKERGTYDSYEGSKWDRGLLPQDTISLLEEERGDPVDVEPEERLDWSEVREHVAEHGMRNSNTTAVAPTATISTIAGTTPSIEPRYSNLYVKSNMSGDFTVVNEHLVEELDELGLWTDEMRDEIKFHDGAIQEIESIPPAIREHHRGAFEIDPRHQLELTARRAIWVDQSQSHNVFFPSTDGTLLDDVYQRAWELGLKTTYYLRTLGASQFEKSTLDMEEYGRTQRRDADGDGSEDDPTEPATDGGESNDGSELPSVEDPTCEACQ